jgi:hypothetical protein
MSAHPISSRLAMSTIRIPIYTFSLTRLTEKGSRKASPRDDDVVESGDKESDGTRVFQGDEVQSEHWEQRFLVMVR